MTIVNVTEDIKKKLRNSNFPPIFIENCINSKFLAIEQENSEIDLSYSIRNFEKVQETLKEVNLTTN